MAADPADRDRNFDALAASAVQGLTVPQVRASLAALRHRWAAHSPTSPLYTCEVLPCGIPTATFAFQFIMGHHMKRRRDEEASATRR
jgi:hypothetical protein